MRRSAPLSIVFIVFLQLQLIFSERAHAQSPEEPAPTPLVETPPPPVTPPLEEHLLPELTSHEQEDAVVNLGELRGVVRVSPQSAADRLKLAQSLYRLGDLDAAIDECRVAIKLNPDDAQAHLQLGVMLMAKQEWRAALSVLKEAIRLEPELTQAYYNLGGVHYSLGQIKAAIQSYRQALELQPHFPDARYRLALLLKLTNHDQEAAHLMEEAAIGGVPQAQFFLGNAYRYGQGVDKNLAQSIFWWTTAAEFGHQPAVDALSKLRRQALLPDQTDRRRKEALDAFRAYRDMLWKEFPDYQPADNTETLGATLLKQNRAGHAISILLKESYALSEDAQGELARLYEAGWDDYLPRFDKRILICFEATAADGFLPAKKNLARIYARGFGVDADRQKSKAMMKGLPKAEIKSLLDELNLQ